MITTFQGVQNILKTRVEKLNIRRDVPILTPDAVVGGGLEVSFEEWIIMMRFKNSKVPSGKFGP